MLNYFERRRQRQEKEDQAIQEGRLPPGQSLTEKWPVLSAGPVPRFDPATWNFRVFGLVRDPRSWSWQDFRSLPRETSVSDIHCVTRWTKLDNTWEGIPPSVLLGPAGVEPRARFVIAHAPGYTANLPLEALLAPDTIIAFRHDGKDLAPEHGGPVRLVVPQLYFWKSVKWLNGLELTAEDRPGFWERNGYHMRGDPWDEERYSSWW